MSKSFGTMRSIFLTLISTAAVVSAASLADVCTIDYIQKSLPADDFYNGITIDASSVQVQTVYNYSVSGQNDFPDGTFDYCNATWSYSHNGLGDIVWVTYWLPDPDSFQNRFLSTGGGGQLINSQGSSLPGGLLYGAVAGLTDGGFGGFDVELDEVFLVANGTVNWQSVFMFGYQAIHEMTVLGKEFTKLFFDMSNTKLYSYYQACSEGGREGWSQLQRFPDQWDGAITGAPAFRYGHQQANHLYSSLVEYTLDYYPPPCELEKIVNETIASCDPLDGKTDGVISRTDLCKLKFNVNSTIGLPYYCAASSEGGGFGKRQAGGTTPAQNGTVSAQGALVASTIINGLHDLQGRRAYLSYQPGAAFDDAATSYNSETNEWELSITGLGGEWISRFVNLYNSSTLASYENVTYDTLRDWMYEGWQRYEDTWQTTWPDLTPLHNQGVKVLHYHGESDPSIPTASSVHYWESVREIMYPNMTYNASAEALNEWYKLFIVPGAAHCSPNSAEENGPWPHTNLAVMIDWVENGVEPVTLNATHLAGDYIGQSQQLCGWPLRPYWKNNGSTMICEYDQASIDTWHYTFDAFQSPVY